MRLQDTDKDAKGLGFVSWSSSRQILIVFSYRALVFQMPVSSTATAHVCIHAPREAVLPLQLEVPEDRAGEHGLSPALMQLVSEASHQESALHTESYTH